MKCHEFLKIDSEQGIFDDSIDCTYIIHLESDNERMENIKKQLSVYKPTKTIFVYNNKGFKNCTKELYEQNPRYDVIDSYIQIFKHAQEQDYNNVLIYEDDFIVDSDISQEDIVQINNFCNENKENDFILSTGLIPVIGFPINQYFYRSLVSFAAHSIIYSKKFRTKCLNNQNKCNIYGDWDLYIHFESKKYFYYKPLVYQKIEETENQKSWYNFFGLKSLSLYYFELMDFLNEPKTAFQRTYYYFLYVNILIFLFILFIIVYFLYKIKILSKFKKMRKIK